MTTLPSYTDDHLSELEPIELLELIVHDEDRVPRNVIDAAVRHGDAMVAALEHRLVGFWEETEVVGEWWLRLHAVMILGLIPKQNAGSLLVDFMRRMSVADDNDLQDWLAGDWPALFANKPASVIASLRALCSDATLDWYIRANALDPVVASAERQGTEALDEALAWVAQMAADEHEDWDMRLSCGNTLIDFPREPYRPLLDDLAKRQHGRGMYFSSDEVARAYAARRDEPEWRTRDDPWKFYRPEFIARRQERWAEEAMEEEDGDNATDAHALPYTRETPKRGRNDPCPCGSGKKYKKCCRAT